MNVAPRSSIFLDVGRHFMHAHVAVMTVSLFDGLINMNQALTRNFVPMHLSFPQTDLKIRTYFRVAAGFFVSLRVTRKGKL